MKTKTTCRIGSDVDLLSRVQLDEVVALLEENHPKDSIEFVRPDEVSSLKNSRTLPNSPSRISLLMNALLEGSYDAVVLDAALVPSKITSGLTIGAITARLTPYDALISTEEWILDELPDGATLVANSFRREAQMRYYRSDLRIVQSKGGVDAIVQKVVSGQIDAAVLAAADMERLGRQEHVVELLTNSVCVPAAGQGALAVLVRSSEEHFVDLMQSINDASAYSALRAEWSFLEHLGVDSTSPVGVLGWIDANALELEGVLAFPDGREKIHFLVKGLLGQEEDLGGTLAQEILDAGGREILEELHLL